jgi:Fe-S cluster assembly protein SufD
MQTVANRDLAARWSAALAAADLPATAAWLEDLRRDAARAFDAGGLPHRKVEAWKYTPLKLLESFAPLAPDPSALEQTPEPPWRADRGVTLVDGRPSGGPWQAPPGLRLLPLSESLDEFEKSLRRLFGRVSVEGAARAFTALNTVWGHQGLLIHVAAGVDAGSLCLHWRFSGQESVLHHSRVVVLLEPGARLNLLEQQRGGAAAAAGLNAVLLADLAEGSELRHLRLQAESERAVLLTSTEVVQAADSRYVYNGFDLGAQLARHEIRVSLEGAGASADLAGAFVLDGRRYADHHIAVEHAAPDCRSEQFFRGVLGGSSRGVFNGKALIQPGADGSSVRQSNANLLLSPLAEMDTKPELEIYADEVEASHGATVGQLDDAAIFYLRSRGLSETEARRMLTTAFCTAVTDRLADRELAAEVAGLLKAAMPVNPA